MKMKIDCDECKKEIGTKEEIMEDIVEAHKVERNKTVEILCEGCYHEQPLGSLEEDYNAETFEANGCVGCQMQKPVSEKERVAIQKQVNKFNEQLALDPDDDFERYILLDLDDENLIEDAFFSRQTWKPLTEAFRKRWGKRSELMDKISLAQVGEESNWSIYSFEKPFWFEYETDPQDTATAEDPEGYGLGFEFDMTKEEAIEKARQIHKETKGAITMYNTARKKSGGGSTRIHPKFWATPEMMKEQKEYYMREGMKWPTGDALVPYNFNAETFDGGYGMICNCGNTSGWIVRSWTSQDQAPEGFFNTIYRIECPSCREYVITYQRNDSPKSPFKMNAETFDVEFNEWADQELMSHGKDISFKDWAQDEGMKHGNSEITEWAQHEDESHNARYGAETFNADYTKGYTDTIQKIQYNDKYGQPKESIVQGLSGYAGNCPSCSKRINFPIDNSGLYCYDCQVYLRTAKGTGMDKTLQYDAETFEDFKRKMVGDRAVAGDVGYMESLEEFYEDYLKDFEQITDEFCPEPETFEEFQERVLKNEYETFDFEPFEAEGKKRSGLLSEPFEGTSLDSGEWKGILTGFGIGLLGLFGYSKLRK